MSERDRFEEWLGEGDLPRARPAFRARLRERFLAGEEGSERERKTSSQSPELSRIRGAVEGDLEALLARDPLPRARDSYRAELRERFLGPEGSESDPDVLTPVPPAEAPPRPVGLLRRVVVLTAAAAAFLLVTFYLPHAPRWRVETIQGGDSVEVAGVEFGPRDTGRIADALTRGASLDTKEARLDLGLTEGLELRVLAGTRVELAALPDLGGDDPIVLTLDRGEVYVKTRAGYPGNPILIETPEQRIHVTGTVLGVMRDENGTCCCVARGEVEVEDLCDGGDLVRVGTCHSLMAFEKNEPGVLRAWDDPDDALRAHTAPLLAFAAQP